MLNNKCQYLVAGSKSTRCVQAVWQFESLKPSNPRSYSYKRGMPVHTDTYEKLQAYFELQQHKVSPRPLVMMLKWWGPSGYRTHSAWLFWQQKQQITPLPHNTFGTNHSLRPSKKETGETLSSLFFDGRNGLLWYYLGTLFKRGEWPSGLHSPRQSSSDDWS